MSLLPTPNAMSIVASGRLFPITELYQYRQTQQQLPNQPYLLVNPDRSLYPNYYLVYVPLIGSPSTSSPNMVATTMSTSVLQTSTLLNSLLTASSLFNAPSFSNGFMQKPSSVPSTSSSSIAFIREQYRYNMRPSYRYVQLLSISSGCVYLFIVHIYHTNFH